MFIGSVPKPVIEQIINSVNFHEWRKVYVGCSGSFRFDHAVGQKFPGVPVCSNDVSLLTCALGAIFTDQEFPITFTGPLAFIEDIVPKVFFDRVAAVMVAYEMSRYSGKNEYAKAHFAYFREHFEMFHGRALTRLRQLKETIHIDEFFPGDFTLLVDRAQAEGAGLAAFPPTYKGGYERIYKFLNENISWPSPDYDVWDPKQLPAWIDGLAERGIPFCVIADQLIDGRGPAIKYLSNTNKPVYCYVSNGRASLRQTGHKCLPFRYVPVDPEKITRDSRVSVLPASSQMMNFLKDKYLSKGIAHVSGALNFLVYIDGCLAGGFIYARSKFGHIDRLYLLSDFSIVRNGRISKLIAKLATCRAFVREAELKFVTTIRAIDTTAFTDKPVSMKYRGVFDLVSRKPGMLQYQATVSETTPRQIFEEWWDKNDSNRNKAGKPKKSKAA